MAKTMPEIMADSKKGVRPRIPNDYIEARAICDIAKANDRRGSGVRTRNNRSGHRRNWVSDTIFPMFQLVEGASLFHLIVRVWDRAEIGVGSDLLEYIADDRPGETGV